MAKEIPTLLKEYGYTEVAAGAFLPARPSSERWEATEGGFFCYGLGLSAAGGEPWGKPFEGGLVQIPFGPKPEYAQASGLHPARNPEAFEWVWPESRLREIYEHTAADGTPNPWRKVQDEGGGVSLVRE